MKKYIYDGPVTTFGTCISNSWHAETMADSERKAKSNLKYQFKKLNNQLPGTKIELPEKLKEVC